MTKTIEAVAERADFGPAYDGEDYVTMTFRSTLDWARTKHPDKAKERDERR
jgi:hypothetical protein